jgi:hypothetical protein
MKEPVIDTLPAVDSAQAVREHTAFHEAGHAIVDALQGLHIQWVALAPARGLVRGGRVVSLGPAFPDTRPAVVAWLAGYCAGLVAESFSPHQQLRDQFSRDDDLLAIEEALHTYAPDDANERERLWQEAHEYAAQLLEQPCHAEAARSIAAALVRQGELTHEEVVALMKGARERIETAEREALRAKWRFVWGCFWGSAVLVLIVNFVADTTLLSLLGGVPLLALAILSSLLIPFSAWKIAQRRDGVAESPTQTPRQEHQSRIWSFADYGPASLERLVVAHAIQQKPEQKQAAPRKKPIRALYDRHRRLPQRRREK